MISAAELEVAPAIRWLRATVEQAEAESVAELVIRSRSLSID
jgi:hypothetical protein